MFDLGALGEFLVIIVAILILFGPKEIPDAVKQAGRWAAKIRDFSREVRHHIDDVIQQAEIDDYKAKSEEEFQEEIQQNLLKKQKDEIERKS